MAKRFTDTDKWKKPFIRGLQGAYKLLWFYICDDCDHAGIWQVDMEVASLRIGEKITAAAALKNFGDKVVVIDFDKWFIPSFIEFQYGELNEKNRAHLSVITKLKKYNLDKNKPLTSPLQGAKDKYMDKEKDKDIKIDAEISEIEIGATIQLVKLTIQRDLSNIQVLDYWKAFCIQTEKDFYPNRNEKIKHFRNWIKKQPNESGTSKDSGKLGTSAHRVETLKNLR